MAVGIEVAVGIGEGVGVGSGVDVGGAGVLVGCRVGLGSGVGVGCSVGDTAPPQAAVSIRIDARARKLRIFRLIISGLDCQF